ncbi:hypothetical protein ACA910_000233 [Epithemia clementina (nom. ined.)]
MTSDPNNEQQLPSLLRMDPNKPIRVACVGGGQLGRMMALEAPRLNIQMSFLDSGGCDSPAGQVVPSNRVVMGGLNDASKIQELAALVTGGGEGAHVVTVEIEHINVNGLAQLEKQGVNVQPSSRVLGIIQDKFAQKQHLASRGVPLPNFRETPSLASIQEAAKELGLPLMLKVRRGGYDGRGNAVLKSDAVQDIETALQDLGVKDTSATNLDIYAEGWIDFDCEIAVMVVRSSRGGKETASYPAVNAIQHNSICRVVLAPARNVPAAVRAEAEQLAIRAVDSLGDGASGVFGVEMFVSKPKNTREKEHQTVLLNEIAPRPHNTGHYTQDACAVSQFENHLRAICGLPLGSTAMVVEAAAMVNVLGAASGTMEDTTLSCNAAMSMPRAVVHWYGKAGCRAGRKMGHINLTGHSHSELNANLAELLALEGIPVSLLPMGRAPTLTSSPSSLAGSPLVGVVMGSQSDLPTMNAAIELLKKFDISYEVDIVSAHRTPDKMMEYSRSAASRGLRVIIAGAGGAAHLPGMIASMTPLPVIGVPVKTSTLSGMDSLYSIVQMPRGVPVATVAIGNAMNAGLLAVRILSASRSELRQQMVKYQNDMKVAVDDSSSRLMELGSDAFLQQMEHKSTSVNI